MKKKSYGPKPSSYKIKKPMTKDERKTKFKSIADKGAKLSSFKGNRETSREARQRKTLRSIDEANAKKRKSNKKAWNKEVQKRIINRKSGVKTNWTKKKVSKKANAKKNY